MEKREQHHAVTESYTALKRGIQNHMKFSLLVLQITRQVIHFKNMACQYIMKWMQNVK
jgi:hypothetical protein